MLSAFVLRAVDAVPVFGFDARAAGTGKSMHADIISEIAEGHPAEAIPPGETREELGKQLATALMRGAPTISIDNVIDPLGDMPLINAASSQKQVALRILGQSRDVIVPGPRLILANGNNLTIKGDLVRRILVVHLDARCEYPENRCFEFHPVKVIQQARAEFLSAAYTILLSFVAAGRPQPDWGDGEGQVTHMGGYEEWDKLVRACVIWLGGADPCGSMRALKAADPDRMATLRALRAWETVFGAWDGNEKSQRPYVTAKALFQGHAGSKDEGVIPTPAMEELREALEIALPSNKKFAPKAIGEWLASIAGQLRAGYTVERAPEEARVAIWLLVKSGPG
jgi:hypothetical protein